ncbi:MAG: bifunctional serine/threonine-protein kinase/formylglycine-generating enzyme family protein [Isosphaeraceae bacterium]
MADDELTLSDLYTLDRVCTEYEMALRAGSRPRVADVLRQVDEPLRPRLLEMLRGLDRDVAPPLPDLIGRYRVLGVLGEGGFGRVYLARDEDLRREVAVKVFHPPAATAPAPGGRRFERELAEARKVARLNHPGIVQIYDIGDDPSAGPFLVFEYIKGRTLEQIYREDRPGPGELAGLVERVAEAVHHAHSNDVIHRDLKPSNILIDELLEAHVTDFGLALEYDPHRPPSREVAGTYLYMAPEQVRGETHRIDRRTDVWALGVIFYRGLTGAFPFPGQTHNEISREILQRDPLPPDASRPSVPRELGRICQKCLSKRMSGRYQTAAELVRDLRQWATVESTRVRATPSPTPAPGASPSHTPEPEAREDPRPTPTPPPNTDFDREGAPDLVPKVVPRGPRAFEPAEADDFLVLMPGPRGRDQLPESLRFWKAWAEAGTGLPPGSTAEDADADSASVSILPLPAGASAGDAVSAPPEPAEPSGRVGLLYGPSGGGKSSFVRAGLIPRLNPGRVECVYIAATPSGTEPRLLAALRRALPCIPEDANLPAAFAEIRRDEVLARAEKVLVVIDQFEQWLQGHSPGAETELAAALLQCDGRRVQALVLVRDDFWMAVTRFFQAIEVPLLEGKNSAAVELPDVRQACAVLHAYGRACGRLTGPDGGPSEAEEAFIQTAAADLAGTSDRVLPVRLSVFTEVVRRRDWTPATLDALGGVKGIGEKQLEEAFDSPFAPPSYRLLAQGAQAVLQALLPPAGSAIRRTPRPMSELAEVVRLADPGCDPAALLDVLTGELKLVSQADPSGLPGGPAAGREPHYQFSHDYLIAPARSWVERKSQASRSGRARLLLATTSAQWAERPQSRRLPSLAEWVNILWFTDPRKWAPAESRMMRAAAVRHATRAAAAVAAGAALVLGGGGARPGRGRGALPGGLVGPARRARRTLPQGRPYLAGYEAHLAAVEADSAAKAHHRALASALLFRGRPSEARGKAVAARLLQADPDEAALLRAALASHPAASGVDGLWRVAADPNAEPAERLRACAALASLDPSSRRWAEAAPAVARALPGVDRADIHRWARLLDPARALVAPALRSALLDPSSSPAERAAAAEALIASHGTLHPDPSALASLIPDASPEVFPSLVRAIDRPDLRAGAVAALEESLPALGPDRPASQGDSPLLPQLAARRVALGFLPPEEGAASVAPEAVLLLARVSGGPDPEAEAAAAVSKVIRVPFPGRPDPHAEREQSARRSARALAALAALGRFERVWPSLGRAANHQLRWALVDQLARTPVHPRPFLERAASAADPAERQSALIVLAELATAPGSWSGRDLSAAGDAARALRLTDPDPGVHSGAELLLTRLGRRGEVNAAVAEARPAVEPAPGYGWFVGHNGHTFAVAGPLEGWVGTPSTEPEHHDVERLHYVRVGRTLAVSTTEVTCGQFLTFLLTQPDADAWLVDFMRRQGADVAAGKVNWYWAVRYCNWLSARAGLAPCYPEKVGQGMVLADDAPDRPGYRLWTEHEWELACRLETTTSRPFGSAADLLGRYAWTYLNSDDRIRPVGQLWPTAAGLFDVIGNAWEWCHDGPATPMTGGLTEYPRGTRAEPAPDRTPGHPIVGDPDPGKGSLTHVRAMRGGGYDYAPSWARSGSRYSHRVYTTNDYNGFRVVRTLRVQ